MADVLLMVSVVLDLPSDMMLDSVPYVIMVVTSSLAAVRVVCLHSCDDASSWKEVHTTCTVLPSGTHCLASWMSTRPVADVKDHPPPLMTSQVGVSTQMNTLDRSAYEVAAVLLLVLFLR